MQGVCQGVPRRLRRRIDSRLDVPYKSGERCFGVMHARARFFGTMGFLHSEISVAGMALQIGICILVAIVWRTGWTRYAKASCQFI
jgi:hypothetical protein